MTGLRDTEGMVVFPIGRVMNAWLKKDILDAYENLLQGLLDDWLEKIRRRNENKNNAVVR